MTSQAANMAALQKYTLSKGKFSWQMLWTGGADDSIGGTGLRPLVTKGSCAVALRAMCNASAPAQTRAMAYGMSGSRCFCVALPSGGVGLQLCLQ